MLHTTFRSIWASCFRRKDFFRNQPIRKKELSVAAMFVNESGQNEQSEQETLHRCFLPCFASFGKAVSEEKTFRNRPIRNKNGLRRPYLLMDRDEMSNLHRRPPIDASYKVSVHLAKRFQGRRFFSRNQRIRNKNCLRRPYS